MARMTSTSTRFFALALALVAPACGSSADGAAASSDAEIGACSQRVAPLPSEIDLGGEVSSVAIADLDGDGCRDIAAYVVSIEANELAKASLVVAFGDARWTYARRWKTLIAEERGIQGGPRGISTRDTSDDAVAMVDVDGDGKLDVLTASGVARWAASGVEWTPLPRAREEQLSPVRLFDLDGAGTKTIVRGTHDGEVERCDLGGECRKLPRAGADTFPVTDIVVGDFDHDGREDLLVGRHQEVAIDAQFFETYRTWLYGSRARFATPSAIDGMHSVDLEVADFDGDGFPDVASQVRETISDFPSITELWASKPTGFEKRTVLRNHDNHQDKAKLADVDGDGCVDYLKIGVDVGVAVHWGRCSGRVVTYEERAVLVSSKAGIGVQLLDPNGDGKGELVVRSGDRNAPKLIVLPAPRKP